MKPSVSYLGAFEASLWSKLLPQAAAEEDFARHAVMALGAVNEAAQASQEGTLEKYLAINTQHSPQQYEHISSKHHKASLQHYARAIALMQEQLSNSTFDARQIQNALVACTLFCSLEHAYGGLEAALRPLQAGVNLLLDFQESRRKSNLVSATTGSSIIDSELLDIFLHFETIIHRVQNKTESRYAPYQFRRDSAALEKMPSKFSLLSQSRIYLDLIHRRFQNSPFERLRLPDAEETLLGSDHERLGFKQGPPSQTIDLYQRLISRWQEAFAPLLRRCQTDTRNTPYLMAASYLELRRLLLDLDVTHLDCLVTHCSHETALESCETVAILAIQLLDSDEVIVMRGPTIPRYNMLLEEVVSLIFRIADQHDSPSIAKIANDLHSAYQYGIRCNWKRKPQIIV